MANLKPSGKGSYYKKRYNNSKHRKNERIRAREIRVIGPDGKQVGVMPTFEAINLAKRYGLDLVEISPNVRPPICKILDYGKFMYDESKKAKKSATAKQKQKEIKFRLNIDNHDYFTKIKRSEAFLNKDCKLKLTLMFKGGRELAYKDRGFEVIKRACEDLKTMGTVDSPPKLAGRNITLTMSPLPANKRVLKFNLSGEDIEDIEDEDENEDT